MAPPALAFAPLLAAALWGGMYVVSYWGFGSIPPLTLAFLRVALGAAVLYGIIRLVSPNRRFSREDWRVFTVLAVWLTAALTTQFVGTELTTASQGALLTVLTPVFMLFLGVLVLSEDLTWWKVTGVGVAGFGTILVLFDQYELATVTSGSAFGVGLLIFSSYAFAAFTVYGAPVIRRYSALESVTYATIISVPMFALFVPFELVYRGVGWGEMLSWFASPGLIGAVLYLGVLSTAAAWYCWYKGLEYVDAGVVAVFFFAQPVVGAVLGAAFLGDSLGVWFVLGGFIMAVGIYIVSIAGRETREDSGVEAPGVRSKNSD